MAATIERGSRVHQVVAELAAAAEPLTPAQVRDRLDDKPIAEGKRVNEALSRARESGLVEWAAAEDTEFGTVRTNRLTEDGREALDSLEEEADE